MSSSEPLDPKRPWITDPDDLPKARITLRTLVSPFGNSARLPFKRAYLIILMLSMPFVVMLIGAAFGGGGALVPLSALGVLSIFLTIAHVRRLNDADRMPLLSGLVVLPVVAGFAVFAAVAPAHVEESNKILAQIEADKADPVGAAKRKAEAAKKARAQSPSPNARGRGRPGARRGGRGRRGGAGGPGSGGADEDFNPTSYVVDAASAWPARAALIIWLPVTLWSLMWVARLPRSIQTSDVGQAEPLQRSSI